MVCGSWRCPGREGPGPALNTRHAWEPRSSSEGAAPLLAAPLRNAWGCDWWLALQPALALWDTRVDQRVKQGGVTRLTHGVIALPPSRPVRHAYRLRARAGAPESKLCVCRILYGHTHTIRSLLSQVWDCTPLFMPRSAPSWAGDLWPPPKRDHPHRTAPGTNRLPLASSQASPPL
jgi:hypothetical protein